MTTDAKIKQLAKDQDDAKLKLEQAEARVLEANRKLEEAELSWNRFLRDQRFACDAEKAENETSLPQWCVKWIKSEAYARGSGQNAEVDQYIISMIKSLELYRKQQHPSPTRRYDAALLRR